MKEISRRTQEEDNLIRLYIIVSLRDAGIMIGSTRELWGILDKKDLWDKRELIINIFFNLLKKIDSVHMLDVIVRSMATKNARPFAGLRLIEFFNEVPNEFKGLKWAIGNSVWACITHDMIDSIMEIIKDGNNGASRRMFILALGKIRAKETIPFLIPLLNDDTINLHIISALKSMDAVEAKDQIENILNHKSSVIRKDAKKALEKFEKIRLKQIDKERRKNMHLIHNKD